MAGYARSIRGGTSCRERIVNFFSEEGHSGGAETLIRSRRVSLAPEFRDPFSVQYRDPVGPEDSSGRPRPGPRGLGLQEPRRSTRPGGDEGRRSRGRGFRPNPSSEARETRDDGAGARSQVPEGTSPPPPRRSGRARRNRRGARLLRPERRRPLLQAGVWQDRRRAAGGAGPEGPASVGAMHEVWHEMPIDETGSGCGSFLESRCSAGRRGGLAEVGRQ